MRLPKIHPVTAALLIVVAALLAWANLRTWEFAKDFGVHLPDELDRVTRYFFARGWPLSPIMVSSGMRLRPEEIADAQFVLLLDAIVACLILAASAVLSEWLVGRVSRLKATDEKLDPQSP